MTRWKLMKVWSLKKEINHVHVRQILGLKLYNFVLSSFHYKWMIGWSISTKNSMISVFFSISKILSCNIKFLFKKNFYQLRIIWEQLFWKVAFFSNLKVEEYTYYFYKRQKFSKIFTIKERKMVLNSYPRFMLS